MTSKHFKLYAAVFPLIRNEAGEILLHLRQNTGYMDGYWDLAGTGHIDPGEPATAALIRECQEELGIDIALSDLTFAHVVHRVGAEDDFPYLYLYFWVNQFQGVPQIMEADKNGQLGWFALDKLPEKMIKDRREAITNILTGQVYGEWQS